MGKRKSDKNRSSGSLRKGKSVEGLESSKYAVEETFNDLEDDFFAGRDKILLEEGPKQKRRKIDEDEGFLQPSDEEILQYPDSDADGSDNQVTQISGSEAADGVEDEDEIRGWGTSKADYYDADVIETEADALEEEAEARRLQQKRIQSMAEEDFGFDETQWGQDSNEKNEGRRTVVEKLPEIHISDQTSAEDRLKILRSRFPEFEPLAKDFADLQTLHQDLRLEVGAASTIVNHRASRKKGAAVLESQQTPSAVTKFRALSAYLSSIAMYFALLTSPEHSREGQISATRVKEMREHPVMEMLMRCRKLWHKAQDLKAPDIKDAPSDFGDSSLDTEVDVHNIAIASVKIPLKLPKATKREPILTQTAEESSAPANERKKRRRRAQNDLDAIVTRVESSQVGPDIESDFGDEMPLTVQEAAEKARRKKSLRFYSSQIAQKSNKRGAASRDAGGDDDLPRKERLKERQARLLQDAERRGREAPNLNEQLDNDEVHDTVHSDSNEYYDLLSKKSKQKKQVRKERKEQISLPVPLDYEEERFGPDGKRAITYAIEKNKGLMPRRKKEVRNPRVKKRMKFEEKMKKLGSVRQLYKGGEGRGGYGGELTGIKTNLVKSVKL